MTLRKCHNHVYVPEKIIGFSTPVKVMDTNKMKRPGRM